MNFFRRGFSLINNELMLMYQTARRYLQSALQERKDIDAELGYPDTPSITAELLREMYDREPIAARVVDIFPEESWKVHPRIYETGEESDTEFEKAWKELPQQLNDQSLFGGEEGSTIWECLKRLDKVSGIGRYGVLLLGFDDGKPLNEPVVPSKGMRLLYMRPFDESRAKIEKIDLDRNSPRFGQPVSYQLNLVDESESDLVGGGLTTVSVHYTRVIHVADNLVSNEIYGVPRMRPVFNRLHDLKKLYGGSAEMYWKGAFPGIAFETSPELGPDVEVDKESLHEELEAMYSGLQRFIALTGVSVRTLSPTVVDPSSQIDVHLTAIAIRLGIPKRIFMGSERGELASSQDERTWTDRVKSRQINYITPRIIAPFIDRLINLKVLPQPKQYFVEWPDLYRRTERERVEEAALKIDAIGKYLAGGVNQMVSPTALFTRFFGENRQVAEDILREALEEQDKELERMAQRKAKMAEMMQKFGVKEEQTGEKEQEPGKTRKSEEEQ